MINYKWSMWVSKDDANCWDLNSNSEWGSISSNLPKSIYRSGGCRVRKGRDYVTL
jgi:hypothetical protein